MGIEGGGAEGVSKVLCFVEYSALKMMYYCLSLWLANHGLSDH